MTPFIVIHKDRNTYRNETNSVAKTLAHSPYPTRVSRLHNICELDFLVIYYFPKDFSLDTVVFIINLVLSNELIKVELPP